MAAPASPGPAVAAGRRLSALVTLSGWDPKRAKAAAQAFHVAADGRTTLSCSGARPPAPCLCPGASALYRRWAGLKPSALRSLKGSRQADGQQVSGHEGDVCISA